MTPLCALTNCQDPACRLTHLVACVFCGEELEEEEAVETIAGLSCERCAIRRDEEDRVCE